MRDTTAQDIIDSKYELDKDHRQFPLTIYVHDAFDAEQQEAIYHALLNWKSFSNNIVTFQVGFGWHPEKPFDENYYANYPAITVWRIDWDDPAILELLLHSTLIAHGLSIDNFIIIIDIDDLDYWSTYKIFKHEFGHTLGLRHIKPAYPALMNLKNGNGGFFSEYDKIMFCYIYTCK